ncbi:MAG: N-acetyltransferase [Bacteroidetes bacterium]|nr:MAG: N-acetyltransferase [Bacteroidota bacterium]
MSNKLTFRAIQPKDAKIISNAFQEQGWNKPKSLYQSYLNFQSNGKRDIIIAEINNSFAGYLTILWQSDYAPFREKGIPEINDFNVLEKFQRRGIGSHLMDEAENRIKQRSPLAGIGFGVTKDYGKAQILYIKRGYVPDGNGMVRNHLPLNYGAEVTVDDDLVLYLTKKL